MLDRLSTVALTHAMFFGPDTPQGDEAVNKRLGPEISAHLNLSKGERIEGRELTFRANSGSAFKTEWPLVLLDEEFKGDRQRFEAARQRVFEEARNALASGGSATGVRRAGVSLENWQHLQWAVDKLRCAIIAGLSVGTKTRAA